MAKFCSKCGKKLVDDRCLDCAVEVTTNVKTTTNFDEMGERVIGILKGFIIKPVSTVKKYSETKDFYLGLIAIGVACISFALVFTVMLNGLLSLFLGGMINSFMVSGVLMFIQGFFLAVLFYGVFVFGVYLTLAQIMKQKFTLKESVALVGTASFINVAICLGVFIMSFLSIQLMVILLLMGIMFFAFNIFSAMKINAKVKEDHVSLSLVAMYGILLLIITLYLQIAM